MFSALEGIKVIDISQVVAVPTAARHLADFGAEVIHIENPEAGDFWRAYQAGAGGTAGVPSNINYNWETYNRNKRSMALDLSQQEGQEILHKLVEKSDVFVTNLRMYERENFRVTYDILHQVNPRLIYGSVTGHGPKGPDRDMPAYDHTAAWYRSGIQYSLSLPGAPCVGFRPGFIDTAAGMSLFAGVMMALYVREKTGTGQEIELSLFNQGIYQLSFDIAAALATGTDYKEWALSQADESDPLVKRFRQAQAEAEASLDQLFQAYGEMSLNPLAGEYLTKDGRLIHLNVLQPDRYWSRMCQAIGQPDLEHDPRFESFESRTQNHIALYHIIREAFRSKTLGEWKARLKEATIPFGVQQKPGEVVKDPQARANDYFVPFDHPSYGRIEMLASPLKLSETPASIRMPAPEFSQHTEEVLLELGYTWEDIARFKQRRTIP
jgi:crotonobetainyl-CoA:carnitine CoA-transferase CaiB-like acyl-CoA transferase